MDAASLRALKRADLQRLAKVSRNVRSHTPPHDRIWGLQEFNVKANLKNDTIIELLLQRFRDKAG